MTEGNTLREDLEELRRTSSIERLGTHPVTQLVFGTLPYAGGVGAMLTALIQEQQSQRMGVFLERMLDDLEEIRIQGAGATTEIISSESFAVVALATLREASTTQDEEKLAYLRRFLAAASRTSKPDASWTDLFFKYVQQMSGSHLVVLERVYDLQRLIAASDRLGRMRMKNVPISHVHLDLKHYAPDLTRICLSDLSTMGLVSDWRLLSGDPKSVDEYSISRNGVWFMRYINAEWSITASANLAGTT